MAELPTQLRQQQQQQHIPHLPNKYMDVRIAPCNPCSIEALPIPIRLANGRFVWPMITSCYELTTANNNGNSEKSEEQQHQSVSQSVSDERTATMKYSTDGASDGATIVSSLTYTETSSLTTHEPSSTTTATSSHLPQSGTNHQQNRVGYMDLSLITVPNLHSACSAMPLQFDATPIVLPSPSTNQQSGILDGQWCCMPSYMIHPEQNNRESQNFCFASAHSTGEIQIHALHVVPNSDDDYVESNDVSNLVKIQLLGESNSSITTKSLVDHPSPLCLSLGWDTSAPFATTDTPDETKTSSIPARIVSTYSNGTMAVHDVVAVSTHDTSNADNNNNNSNIFKNLQLIEFDRWTAHTMYPTNTPAEVWTAAFVGDSSIAKTNIVWSGGDDRQLKIWDLRSTNRPMLSYQNVFDAGITCISPHPTDHHIVAVGSYDENIVLIDTRYINQKQTFWKSGNLGGGIWRMKWHPYTKNRMLVGAMHGGCCVLNFLGTCLSNNNSYNDDSSMYSANHDEPYNSKWDVKCTKYFTEHESMVYGADWLVCPHPTQNGYFEAAASCSFYDRALYIWDSVY